MKITPIDDSVFREDLVSAFVDKGSPRRYELHLTDAINCIMCSFLRKIFPEPRGEEKYGDILDWAGGLVFDSTITSRFGGKHTVWVGDMQGNVDMMVRGIPYELTSTMFLSKDFVQLFLDGKRYSYKLEQLRLYMSSLCVTQGRFKVLQRVKVRKKEEREAPVDDGYPPISPKKKFKVIEHTFDVRMTPLELAQKRMELIERSYALAFALATGIWRSIPRGLRPISDDSWCLRANGKPGQTDCSGWVWALDHRKLVDQTWKEWRAGFPER